MVLKILVSMGIVLSLSVAGSYLLQEIQEESSWTEKILPAECDPNIVLHEGRLTVLADKDNHPGGTLVGSLDGRIILQAPDGTPTDYTICLAARLNAGPFQILSSEGTVYQGQGHGAY